MCGFVLGTLCLIAFFKLARGGRCHGGGCGGGWRHRRHGYGGGCHHGYCHHGGEGPGPFGGFGPGRFGGERWMLRALFERLDTTPGQEKVIVAAFEESRDGLRESWKTVRDSRGDLARALRSDTFDEEAVTAARSRHEEAMKRAHEVFTSAMRKVHEALDSKQRALLADIIDAGPYGVRAGWRGGFGEGGPYRSA
jgi:Spy/CpxP family protein refolding chaperone